MLPIRDIISNPSIGCYHENVKNTFIYHFILNQNHFFLRNQKPVVKNSYRAWSTYVNSVCDDKKIQCTCFKMQIEFLKKKKKMKNSRPIE